MSLACAIKDEVRGLGFSLAGVTSPVPPPHWSTFENWLSLGRHGSMDYLTDPRRADPGQVLAECRSIIVLAMRYSKPGPSELNNDPCLVGRVASYAWGRDYHLIIPERLKSLASFIETRIGKKIVYRGYTDTGPILERDMAQLSGLGWIGKNTCLINPKLGSYFFLAEILLGVDLEPDEPFTADRCGKCNRCIIACPTGCILPDRTIDARNCLSYLTIENKKEIPVELRPRLGNWIFGCDICQQICPWNRFSSMENDRAFDPRPGLLNPELIAELSLTPTEFKLKFGDSPILRSKWRGYLRNVAVVLGNSGNPAVMRALEGATQNNDALIREHALWALRNIQTSAPNSV